MQQMHLAHAFTGGAFTLASILTLLLLVRVSYE
jgi:hypothetical protein